jgi:SAM-dependent methyltransferase
MTTEPAQQRTKQLYGLQWNRYRIVRAEEDLATFLLKTGLQTNAFSGKLVLDGGCGMGRYARVAASLGAAVVGMDLSQAAVAAQDMTAEFALHVQIIRGDLLRPPLPSNRFDLVYSIGVLDHTPDPRTAFLELAKAVKPGGRMAVWVYQKQSPVVERIMAVHRAVARRLPVWLVERLSRWSVPVGGLKRRLMGSPNKVIQRLGVALHALTIGVSMHPDPEVRACDTLDWYAPRYVSHHTHEEVRGWFAEAGFSQAADPTLGQAHFHAGQGQGVHMMGIKPLLSDYYKTKFDIHDFQGNWPQAFAIITAFQTTGETWSAEKNESQNTILHQWLTEKQVWTQQLTGFLSQHSEPGWAVELPFEEACRIGDTFQQDAIFWVENGDLFVASCTAREKCRVGRWDAALDKEL